MSKAMHSGTRSGAGGHRAAEYARMDAPGVGLQTLKNKRFCVRCVDTVDPTGGRVVAGMFICAKHQPKEKP